MTTPVAGAPTQLPPESLREVLGNVAQIMKGAIPSSLGHYRLLTAVEYNRAMDLLRDAIAKAEQLEAHRCSKLSASIVEALNAGNGSYRP